ncbi:MAG: hypothetical protein M9953_02940 [Thermomicrobiales bacterium]|nr:hypothetical protein [Thermomicrobiales bacterium]MCO5224272.1 hypothetical protein [Thermomicrobiales bacterium]MCO5229451.1 hypothetical protein [Thermomicrobiales bacterium]
MFSHGKLTSVLTHSANRRRFVAGTVASAVGLANLPAFAQGASSDGDGSQHLFVADAAAELITIYSVPGGEKTGQIEGIKFGTHAGTFLMPDGRLLFADANAQEVVILTIDDAGAPVIEATIPATLGQSVAWISADPSLTWITFGSLMGHGEEAESEHLNIINTTDYTNLDLAFEMSRPEEIHAWLLGDPMHLHVAVGGRIDSYDFAAVQAGEMAVLGSVEVDLGSHGGATDAVNNHLLYVTGPGYGLDVLDGNGPAQYLSQIPWDLDGEAGGRNARPRVTADGRHLIGVMTPGLEDTSVWAETMISNHVFNMDTLEARRVPIDTGAFGYRWGVGQKVAMWVGYNANGNHAYLIDTDVESATFGESIGSIEVAMPSNPWIVGEAWADDQEGYVPSTMTADDSYGFVTISGDGLIQIVDLQAREIIGEITLDSPMAGGGYTTIVQGGIQPADLWGR